MKTATATIKPTRLLTAMLGATVILTQASDALTTNVALALGAAEANPIMDAVIHTMTPGQFLALKVAAGVLIAVTLRRRTEVLSVLSAAFAAVTVWNLTVIAQLI
jgi:hypothetical protein